jgi:hypothetical protein
MFSLINETVNSMAALTPEEPPGAGMPVDKLGWFAQTLTKLMTGGRDFCQSYAITTSMATSRFSDHVLRGAPLSEYRDVCHSRLAASSDAYTRSIGTTMRPGPRTVANDPLVECLMVASFVAEQTRLEEPSRPEK